MNTLFGEIRTKYNTLSPAQKQIADFVLKYSSQVILLSLSDLAERCSTSETTILRFLRKLGFDSYQVFRVRMAQETADNSPQGVYEEIGIGDTLRQVKEKVVYSTVNSIRDLNELLNDTLLEQAVAVLSNARRVFFFGTGSSGAVAMDAYHKFARLGLHVQYSNDSHMMSILSAHTGPEDVLFIISHSGESREVLDAVELAKACRATVIAITSYIHSSLARKSDLVLMSSSNETRYRSDAMVSRILQLVIIDILSVGLVLKSGPAAIDRLNKSRLAVARKKV